MSTNKDMEQENKQLKDDLENERNKLGLCWNQGEKNKEIVQKVREWRKSEQQSLDEDGGHLIMTLDQYNKILGDDIADKFSQLKERIEY